MKYQVVLTYEVDAPSTQEACNRVIKFQTDTIYNQVQKWHNEAGRHTEVVMGGVDIKLLEEDN